jgi:hypothetical protein
MAMATENLIRAGADAAMGHPRFGMIDPLKLLGGLLARLFRSRAAREAEMAFLRQQLVVLQRSAPARLRLRTADRLIFVWLYRLFPSSLEAAVVFKPETLVRWHRSGFRLYWRWKSRRRVGRPAVPADIRDLIRTISRDNPLWGAPRIHGELLKLGIDIAQSTVAKYMSRRHGPRSPGWQASCAITPPTSPASICSSSRRLASNCSTGWSSCVWNGDGSSGPMLQQIQPPSGSPGRSPKHSRGMRRRATSSVTVLSPEVRRRTTRDEHDKKARELKGTPSPIGLRFNGSSNA